MTFVTQCLLLYLRRRNGLLDKKKTSWHVQRASWSNDQTANRLWLNLFFYVIYQFYVINYMYTMFTVLSSRREWISKFKKSDKLTCTESLMIKLSTAILLLVEVEPSVWSVFLVLFVPYFDLYLSVMLEFCRYVRVWRSKRNKKTCFKTLDKGRQWKHFISRVQGLPLASDSVHDKHDA